MAGTETVGAVAPGRSPTNDPRGVVCALAPALAPALEEIARQTWPREVRVREKRFVVFGPTEVVTEEVPPRFRIIVRRRDLFTLEEDWRIEAGGPVEFFEWDESGAIVGAYGVRYPSYSVRPVYDEAGAWAGLGLNCRSIQVGEAYLRTVDARVTCAEYVRSAGVPDVIAGLKNLQGRPRVDEARPGLRPTHELYDVLLRENKRTYFESRGVNQYVGPGWTRETLFHAFDDPSVRAVWIGDREPPKPERH